MWKDFLYYTKTERQGIIVLVVLILGVYAAPKLFSFFTHAEDTDCRENEKFDKEYNDFILYFLPPGNPTSPKVRSFFSIIPSKGNQTCGVRSEHRRLYYFSFAWVTILDDKEYPALSL